MQTPKSEMLNRHRSEAENFDAHDAGQKLEALMNPLSSMFEVGTADNHCHARHNN